MTVAEQYKAYNVYLPTSNKTFTQLDDPQIAPNIQEVIEYGAGAVEPGIIAGGDVEPILSWSTKDLESWAAVFTGAYATDNQTRHAIAPQSGSALMRYQKMRSGSFDYASGGSNHFVNIIRDSIVTWSGVGCDQGGLASVRMQLDGVFDGTNTPISNLTGQALAGGNTPNKIYTLGPIKRDGTMDTGVLGSMCESNREIVKIYDSGLQYPTFAGLGRVMHVVSYRTNTITMNNSPGYISPLTSMVVFYRRRTPGGLNYADAALEHIKLTYGAGAIIMPRIEGGVAHSPVRCIFTGSPVIASGVAIA
jgi:hypothetical protein